MYINASNKYRNLGVTDILTLELCSKYVSQFYSKYMGTHNTRNWIEI